MRRMKVVSYCILRTQIPVSFPEAISNHMFMRTTSIKSILRILAFLLSVSTTNYI